MVSLVALQLIRTPYFDVAEQSAVNWIANSQVAGKAMRLKFLKAKFAVFLLSAVCVANAGNVLGSRTLYIDARQAL